MDCQKCKSYIDNIVNFGDYGTQEIECPKCGHKMFIEYEEFYNDETCEEFGWWQFAESE